MINRIKDVFCDGYIKRISGNKTMIIEDDKLIKVEQTILLKTIPKPKVTVGNIEDRNIGTIDTETYTAKDGTIKIYALGFKTLLDKEVFMYYIDKETRDHKSLVLNFVNELLRTKYSNIRFYCHNLGGYDIVFLLKTLYTANESISDENQKYKIYLTLRANRISIK